jgi:hypothetical protein
MERGGEKNVLQRKQYISVSIVVQLNSLTECIVMNKMEIHTAIEKWYPIA